jgi:uncharacterized protein YdaU (DUF1376 family)
MSGQPWYRHNPRDFLDGIVGMTPDLIGAYIVCLDLIYARGGPIPNDARWLSGTMGCSTRAAASLVSQLIDRGKLVNENDHLTNERALTELVISEKNARNAAETGAKGGRTKAEHAAKIIATSIKSTAPSKAPSTNIDKIREEKKERVSEEDTLSAGECEAVAAEWNAMAKRTGLPICTVVTPSRRQQIRARISEHGRQAFTEAIGKIEASPFCRGEVGNFTAKIDFMLQPSSFLKILEGNYDGNATRLAATGVHQPQYRRDPAWEGLKRLHAELEG